MTALAPIPVRPVYPAPPDTSRALARAMTAHVLREIRGPYDGSADDIAAREWPRDLHAKAATSAINTSGAAALQPVVVGDFLAGLQPISGAARLMAAGIRVDLEGNGTVSIPRAVPGTSPGPTFIGEGSPIPVPQAVFSAGTVGPMKRMAMIEAVSGWLVEHSVPVVETVLNTIMSESTARSLDAAVFSSTAASSLRPAGLLAGVTPLTATAITGGSQAAAAGDIELIGNAIAAAGGGSRLMLFVAPGKAMVLPMLAPALPFDVVPALGLAADTIIGLDPSGFVSAYGPNPEFTVSQHTTLHLESTTPLDLASGVQGSAVVATPSQSMFQQQAYAMRLVLRCAWAMRGPGLVQTITAVTW